MHDFPVVQARVNTPQGSNRLDHTVVLPAGIVAGEMLLAVCFMDGNPVTTLNTAVSGTGWTMEGPFNAGTSAQAFYAWKIAEGGDALRVDTTATEQLTARAFRISGANRVADVNLIGSAAPPIPVPAITPNPGVSLKYLAIAAQTRDGGLSVTTYPAGYSNGGVQAGSANAGSTATAELLIEAETIPSTTYGWGGTVQGVSWHIALWHEEVGPPPEGQTYFRSIGGMITAAGGLLKRTRKNPAGTLTGSGTINRLPRKRLTGSVTGSGIIRRLTRKRMAGAVAGSGALLRAARRSRSFGGTLNASSVLRNSTRKRPSGAITSSGSIVRWPRKRLTATVTGSGHVRKKGWKFVAGAVAATGTLLKRTRRAVAGFVTGAGAVTFRVGVRLYQRLLTGSMAASGTVARRSVIRVVLAGIVTAAGVIRKGVRKRFTGAITGFAPLRRFTRTRKTGSITGSGTSGTRFTLQAKILASVVVAGGTLFGMKIPAAPLLETIQAAFYTMRRYLGRR
jgi:hypothetical protein